MFDYEFVRCECFDIIFINIANDHVLNSLFVFLIDRRSKMKADRYCK